MPPIHQPMPGDDASDSPDHIGWDANGSPLPPGEPVTDPAAMPTWRPEPLQPIHPLLREQPEPHRCWICERTTPRTSCGGRWLVALVIGQRGGVVRVWTCSAVCQEMAWTLLYGYAILDRWFYPDAA